jgi:hypothetical protein
MKEHLKVFLMEILIVKAHEFWGLERIRKRP